MSRVILILAVLGLVAVPADAYAEGEATSEPFLKVSTETNRQHHHKHPGETLVNIETTAGWHVFIATRYEDSEEVTRDEQGNVNAVTFPWSCSHPGMVVKYVVSAHGTTGPTLRQSGSFKEGSRWWCGQTLRYEAREKRETARRHAEERRRPPPRPPVVYLNTQKVAEGIERAIYEQRGIQATVTCPSVEPQRVGAVFYCQARANGYTTPFEVTVRTNAGHVTFVGL